MSLKLTLRNLHGIEYPKLKNIQDNPDAIRIDRSEYLIGNAIDLQLQVNNTVISRARLGNAAISPFVDEKVLSYAKNIIRINGDKRNPMPVWFIYEEQEVDLVVEKIKRYSDDYRYSQITVCGIARAVITPPGFGSLSVEQKLDAVTNADSYLRCEATTIAIFGADKGLSPNSSVILNTALNAK